MSETVRAFVAIELAAAVKEQLRALERDLQAASPSRAVRWVDAGQLHITLKFLGDTPGGRLAAVEQALEAAVAGHAPFTLRLGGLGAFPTAGRARVVWVGLAAGAAEVVALSDALEPALNPLGFKPERREPQPHITLARVKDWITPAERAALGDALGAAAPPEFPAVTIDYVSLMQSHLTPHGARYQAIAQVRLPG
jgi:2'-5' RNA ligase